MTKSYVLACSIFCCLPVQLTLAVLGPYTLDFTANGRYMAVGGRKGHLGIVDMMKMSLIKEFQVCSDRVELGLYSSSALTVICPKIILTFGNMLSSVILSCDVILASLEGTIHACCRVYYILQYWSHA